MVQLDLKKTLHTKKMKYLVHYDSFVSGELQWTNRKICEMVTLYHHKLLGRPSLGTFCTQPVN